MSEVEAESSGCVSPAGDVADNKYLDYKDESGEWVGFDADMAKAFAGSLGVAVEFIEIDWDNKIMELDNKSIDVVGTA